jgi:hypothetical protein
MGDANYLVNTEDIDGEWLANDKEKFTVSNEDNPGKNL